MVLEGELAMGFGVEPKKSRYVRDLISSDSWGRWQVRIGQPVEEDLDFRRTWT